MNRILAVIALIGLAACARSGVEIVSRDDLPADIYGAASGQRTTFAVLYMVQGNRLVRVARTGRAPGSEAEVAVRQLLAGPTAAELGRGVETKIPNGVELLGLEVDDGVAKVDFSTDFTVLQDPTDTQEYVLRVAQLVWTLDELPNINSVQVQIEGVPVVVYDQFRNEVAEPIARKRFQRFAPRSEKPVSEAPVQIDI